MNTRQIKEIETSITDGTPFKRHSAARKHRDEIQEDTARLAQDMGELRRQHARWWERMSGELSHPEELPAVDVTMRHRGLRMLVAALLILVLEVGLAASIASSWLDFSRLLAAIVGAVLAVILAAIADVLMGLIEDPENPRTSYRKVKSWATWLTISCLFVLAVICLTRFFHVGVVIFPWASGALTILLPATAGSYLTLRSLLETGNRIARHWLALDLEVRQTRIIETQVEIVFSELRDMLAKDGERRPIEEATHGSRDSGPRAASWIILPLLLSMLLSGLIGSPVYAAPWNDQSVVEVWVDTSGSLDNDESLRVMQEIKSLLAYMVRQPNSQIRRIDIYTWATAKDAVRGPRDTIEFYPPPSVVCNPPQLTETERILKKAKEEAVRQADSECTVRRKRAQIAYERFLSVTLVRLNGALDKVRLSQGASQTCVFQALIRAAYAPPNHLVLLLTDAEQQNCEKGSLRTLLPPHPSGFVYVILVPGQADGDDVIQALAHRTNAVKGFLPNARVVPSHEVNGSLSWFSTR